MVMLYERLVLDVRRGLEAQQRGDFEETHRALTHAKDVVLELQDSSCADQFNGSYNLSALYGFLHRQLVMAGIRRDASITDECLALVTELCDTWRETALTSAGTTNLVVAPRSA